MKQMVLWWYGQSRASGITTPSPWARRQTHGHQVKKTMKEVSAHQKVTAKDTAIITAMAQSVYFVDGAYFHDKAMEWREAYEHICNQEAFDLLQDELEKLFGGKADE